MDNEITVPRLDWLIGGSRIGGTYNKYFGSCGTDPQGGCFSPDLFNYAVFIEKTEAEEGEEEGTEYIKAAVYKGTKSLNCRSEDEYEIETFEADENSLPVIKAWIESKYNEMK